ncbi:MAG: BrnT family toxin [Hyphomicrobiales bacterium]|nr:BrnT family toxin [Hyphomicrobiales bacterium]
MKIVWDLPKQRWTFDNRGLDFNDLTIEFFENAIVTDARDGRFKAIGEFRGLIVTVIFRPLGSEAVSVISMRRSNRKERNAYGRP